jgi:L-lactate dehydrogenase complex protein LldG
MKSRVAIMRRIRRALPDKDTLSSPSIKSKPPSCSRQVMIDEFAAEISALSGILRRVPRSELLETIVGLLSDREAKKLLAWDAHRLPEPSLLSDLEQRGYHCVSSHLPAHQASRRTRLKELAQAKAGITGAGGAISQIGALVMPGGEGRPRLASVLPQLHIAIVSTDQFYPTLDAWIHDQNNSTMFDTSSSLTLIAGPSRTSDVERVVTLGAHGPRELIVICIE